MNVYLWLIVINNLVSVKQYQQLRNNNVHLCDLELLSYRCSLRGVCFVVLGVKSTDDCSEVVDIADLKSI